MTARKQPLPAAAAVYALMIRGAFVFTCLETRPGALTPSFRIPFTRIILRQDVSFKPWPTTLLTIQV